MFGVLLWEEIQNKKEEEPFELLEAFLKDYLMQEEVEPNWKWRFEGNENKGKHH